MLGIILMVIGIAGAAFFIAVLALMPRRLKKDREETVKKLEEELRKKY